MFKQRAPRSVLNRSDRMVEKQKRVSEFCTAIEALEPRRLMAAVVVNTVVDTLYPAGDSRVSLRNAIAIANAATSPTTITFDPTVFSTPQTIVSNGNVFELSNTAAATTINGPKAGLTISGNNLVGNGFEIDRNVTVAMSQLTISGFDNSTGGYDTPGSFSAILNVGKLTLTDSTVSNNILHPGVNHDCAPGLVTSGTAVLVNDTFSANQEFVSDGSDSYAGAINSSGTTKIVDSTISGNINKGTPTRYESGGVNVAAGTLTMVNSVVAGNTGPYPDVHGDFNSLGYNLIGATDGGTGFTVQDKTGTAASPLDAKLAALADNSGPTETMLPQTNSPLINAGSNSAIDPSALTDQRGLDRIYGGTVDIGAVEAQPIPTVTVTAPSSQTAHTGIAHTFSLGTFTAPNTTAPYSVDVNWGDGSTDTTLILEAAGTLTQQAHVFTTAGSDLVKVTVTDATGVTGNATFAVDVNTASITVTAPANQTALLSTSTSVQLGSFSEVNAASPFTVNVNWGDGSADTIFTAAAGDLGAQSHVFAAAGTSGVTVTVTDSSGAVDGLATFNVAVSAGTTPDTVALVASSSTFLSTDSITLTATVLPSTATGIVTFLENGVPIGTGTVGSGGVAQLTVGSFTIGSDALTAEYGGDATYAQSVSPAINVAVSAPIVATTVGLQSSGLAVTANQAVTLTATISPAGNDSIPATGTVTFDAGTVALGTVVLGSADVTAGDVANFTTTSGLPVGTDAITATYSGDITYGTSTSAPVNIVVTPTATTLTLTDSTYSKTIAQPMTLTATVGTGAATATTLSGFFPTGTVTFTVGTQVIGTADVDSTGSAILTTTAALPQGTDMITATYAGDSYFLGSTSAPWELGVTGDALVPSSFKVVLPATIVAGVALHGNISTTLTNQLSGIESGPETGGFVTRIYAAAGTTLDTSTDASVTSVTKSNKVGEGKSVRLAIPVTSFPASLATGTYHLFMQVSDARGNVETVDMGTSVNVQAPVIALSGSFAVVPRTAVKAGATLSLTTTGNVNDISVFSAVIGFSTDALGQNIVATGTGIVRPAKLTLHPRKSTRFHATGWQSIATGLASGSYYLTATLTDSAGNSVTFVSASPIQI